MRASDPTQLWAEAEWWRGWCLRDGGTDFMSGIVLGLTTLVCNNRMSTLLNVSSQSYYNVDILAEYLQFPNIIVANLLNNPHIFV